MRSVCPTLGAAIEFYKGALGARERYRGGGTQGSPSVVADIALGDTAFSAADESPAHDNHSKIGTPPIDRPPARRERSSSGLVTTAP
jgi:hypothetical protein